MSLRTAGRLVMTDIPGTELDAATRAHLASNQFRGICLFRRNIASAGQLLRLTNDLRETLGDDVLIAVDQEGGAVMRATFLPDAPSAMALGASDDPHLAYEIGAAMGRGLASLGVNVNFAPVLDVNSNPDNPVIGERSFGGDPRRVARLAAAWAEGCMSAGVACCGKHFPGHGDTREDSHLSMPSIERSYDQLEAVELAPFKALAQQMPMLMTAHVRYAALDPALPATLSPAVLQGLLRGTLGFEGVIISDALNMHAVSRRQGQPLASVMTLQAGADLALVIGDRNEVLESLSIIHEACDSGLLKADAVAASLARLDALAARFRAHRAPYGSRDQDLALIQRAWSAGLTTRGEWQAPLAGQPLRLIGLSEVPGDGIAEAGIGVRAVAQALSGGRPIEVVELSEINAESLRKLPRDQYCNVLVSLSRERLAADLGSPAHSDLPIDLHLVLWNPYAAFDLEVPALIAYGHSPSALHAVREAIDGRTSPPGRFPASAPQPATRGRGALHGGFLTEAA